MDFSHNEEYKQPPFYQRWENFSDLCEQSSTQTTKQEHVGLFGDFVGSFANTLKSQANGATQLLNQFGGQFKEEQLSSLDKAKYGSADWAAELSGQATAMALEMYLVRKIPGMAGINVHQFEKTGIIPAINSAKATLKNTVIDTLSPFSKPLSRLTGLPSGEFALAGIGGHVLSIEMAAHPSANIRITPILKSAPKLFEEANALPIDRISGSSFEDIKKEPTVSERTETDSSASKLFPLDEGTEPFIKKIVEKYQVRTIKTSELNSIIAGFSAQERPLVLEILSEALPNSSEALFKAQMKALRPKLEQKLAEDGIEGMPPFVYTDSAGWGKAFAYLYRKLSGLERNLEVVQPQQLPTSTKAAILVDEPSQSNLIGDQVEALKKLDKLYILGPTGFNEGLNFFDFAQGAGKVEAKLHGLVDKVQALKTSDQKTSEKELIEQVLRGDTQRSITELNGNAVFINSDNQFPGRTLENPVPRTVSGVISNLNNQLVTSEGVEKFLRMYVPENQQPAAYTLAAGGQPITYREMFKHIKTLNEQLKISSGAAISQDKMLFHESNDNDSVDLMNYMYRTATSIPAEQFVTGAKLNQLANAGQLTDKVIVFLDDNILTGDKIGKRFEEVRDSANKSAGVHFATLVKDRDPIFGESGPPQVPFSILQAERVKGISPHKKWIGANESQLKKVEKYTSDSGFTSGLYGDPRIDFLHGTISSNSMLTFPFAMPDNNVSVVRRFGHEILGLRQIRDAKIKPLEPIYKQHVPTGTIPRQTIPASLFQTGKFDVTVNNDSWGISDGEILHPNLSLPVTVRYADSLDALELVDRQGKQAALHAALNLTPRYPTVALREQNTASGTRSFVVYDTLHGGSLSNELDRLSENAISDGVNDGYTPPAILNTDPEMRQIVERALLERMIMSNERQPQFYRTKDMAYIYNGLSDGWDRGEKPVWKGVEPKISRVFEEREISDDTYHRLKSAYASISNDAKLMENWTVRVARQRLEWLLEHRRFPGHTENEETIY